MIGYAVPLLLMPEFRIGRAPLSDLVLYDFFSGVDEGGPYRLMVAVRDVVGVWVNFVKSMGP